MRPFGRAVLARREVGGGAGDAELRDDVLPALWFQRSGSEQPRQRIPLHLWVAPADADGNKVCLCTWQDQDAPDGVSPDRVRA